MRLLLIRHAETPWNAEGRFQGHTDIPLSPNGQRQAAALARVMVTETVHTLYASDLQRTLQTAQTLAKTLGLPVQQEPRLREMSFGAWEGLTLSEIQQQDAELLAARQVDPMRVTPPGGETLVQVTDRVRGTLHELLSTYRERTVVLVAHGGSLRVLLCLALGLSASKYRRFALDHTSLSELYFTEHGPVLTRLNDTHHLTAEDV